MYVKRSRREGELTRVCEPRKMHRKTHKMLMVIIIAGNGIMSKERLGKGLLCFYGFSKVSASNR